PLTPPRAVAIITQIASALDAAHAAGVMHRDVKPPNILVTRDDFAYLVDFGIASATTDEKLTQLGTAVGTWKYMAPERFSNNEVTYRADIYALACVLHEALTGAPPYRADSASVLVTSHLMDPVPQASTMRAGIPRALDAVIARGMAKKPEDRYASAGDLAIAAHEALSNPDQDHADNILRRSRMANVPGPAPANPPPNPPPTLAATPSPAPTQQPSYPGPVTAAPAASSPYYQAPTTWGAQPPGPPQPPSTSWNQPTPPAKRSRWPIFAGIAVLVVVLIGAGVAIVLATQKDKTPQAGQSSSAVSTPSSTTPASTSVSPSNDPQTKLLSLVPKGYPMGTCTTTTPSANSIWQGSVAMVKCTQNTNQGGPSKAIYGLFPNVGALKKAFNDDVAAVQLMNCPGSGPSPSAWHYNSSPDVEAGQVACATYKNQPNVIWSNEGKLVLSDVFGGPPPIEDLYGWWGHNG
ncbi:serine/threonine-protein kinase, partial [Mycobacterium sp.]|uniref:serine/threonine-protein kinase n=1 Tax=Mycobacterium sp. TaxID=1785 RepID=UPI002C732006